MSTTQFKAEIQGLRAVAVISVVLFHVSPNLIPGGFAGVDVFFVISGYLITGVLLKEIENTGRVSALNFYARRIRRLLPAATLVLVVVACCAPLLPAVAWQDLGEQIVASALYYQNWWLAAQAVDYLNAENTPSPLQHFWSLSIEEQYYILWPLLFLLARALGARSSGFDSSRLARLLIWIVLVGSLSYSVSFSYSNPAAAYFVSTTRVWELALGGLLAAYPRLLVNAPRIRRWLGIIGLLGIMMSFWIITPESIFPGYLALLPTLGTAMVIVASTSDKWLSSYAFLRVQVAQFIGDVSYSLYLWHWPVLLFYRHIVDRPLEAVDAVLVIVLSTVLAHQTKRWVEDRFRTANYWTQAQWRTLSAGVVCLLVSMSGGWLVLSAATSSHQKAWDFVPSPLQARADKPAVYELGCHLPPEDDEPKICTFGDPEASTHFVLVGDSHAVQWAPALRQIAEQRGWRLTVLTKSACAFGSVLVKYYNRPYASCLVWSKKVARWIDESDVTHVVSAQSKTYDVFATQDPVRGREALSAGYETMWRKFRAQGRKIIAIRDTPQMPFDVPECLSTSHKEASDCSIARDLVLDPSGSADPIVIAARRNNDVVLLDFSDDVCQREVCQSVTDGILIWRDRHHLTGTFVRSLAPRILEDLSASLVIAMRRGSVSTQG